MKFKPGDLVMIVRPHRTGWRLDQYKGIIQQIVKYYGPGIAPIWEVAELHRERGLLVYEDMLDHAFMGPLSRQVRDYIQAELGASQ